MNKKELVNAIATKTNLTQKQATAALEALTNAIQDTVSSGGKVNLVGFGTFEAQTRKARIALNPNTGEKVSVSAKTVPAFKPGKPFKEKAAK